MFSFMWSRSILSRQKMSGRDVSHLIPLHYSCSCQLTPFIILHVFGVVETTGPALNQEENTEHAIYR